MVCRGATCWVADGWDNACPSGAHWGYVYGRSGSRNVVRWGVICRVDTGDPGMGWGETVAAGGGACRMRTMKGYPGFPRKHGR